MKTLATIAALALATCSPAIASQPVCADMEFMQVDKGEKA